VEGLTQTDIGSEIGVSQMQVSRLLRQILDNLRNRLAQLPSAA
jgi:RNA polymerase sigma-B factor